MDSWLSFSPLPVPQLVSTLHHERERERIGSPLFGVHVKRILNANMQREDEAGETGVLGARPRAVSSDNASLSLSGFLSLLWCLESQIKGSAEKKTPSRERLVPAKVTKAPPTRIARTNHCFAIVSFQQHHQLCQQIKLSLSLSSPT